MILNWLKKIFGIKQNNTLTMGELIDAGVCPNCWGTQEYNTTFIKKYEDFTKGNISSDKTDRKAFIAQFVETHVTGIHLRSENQKVTCKKCNANIEDLIK